MKLSILIPTVVGREHLLERLRSVLNPQLTEDVEVIEQKDNKEISIGRKRQTLLEKAAGEYVVFIDDDDMISEDYVESILKALESNPDSVGFEIECHGTTGKTASASNKWSTWKDNHGGFDYVRTPYHKTPIKRNIAVIIGYRDMRYGEDYDYSKRLKEAGFIKTEVYINKVLYYYMYVKEDFNKKYGI
jgi:GT2 family glycosyltransferase